MKNNLNELNDILFETLRGVKDDKVSEKKAKSITEVSNSIINNAKAQLSAYKLTKGHAFKDTFGSPKRELKGDTYEQKNEFAMIKGYSSVTDAISKMGKSDFENNFKDWVKYDK